MRRGLAAALLLCLAAGVLLLAAASGTWAAVLVPALAPLPSRTVDVSGGDLVGGLRALGVVALAGVPALLSVRRTGRVAVGLLLTAAGLLVVVLAARVLLDREAQVLGTRAYRDAAGVPDGARVYGDGLVGGSAWPYAALLGGVLLLGAGLLAVVRGRSWPALGATYEAPSARPVVVAEPTDKGTWDALDRGEDPTAEPTTEPTSDPGR
ncbi:MAG: Trp biosynthesis associated, transrane protein Oprn/Chp [Frankiales bacterium]|nr:Trp biosynthesis associated, transrane protein Oprn/Chp [Frankiales bacterium]